MILAKNFNECIELIKEEYNRKDGTISRLRKENEKLKSESYKDEELQNMKERLDKMQKDYWRGFPIREDEEKAIEDWKKEHDEKIHGYTKEMRMKAEGVSGGRYSYHFVPTALGTSGVIKCSCGAKFEFQEIG